MDNTPERPLFHPKKDDDDSSPQYRLGIGILGFLLPFLLILTAGLRPTEGLKPWELLDSVSAYYYTEGMFYFVGILLALGVFLVMYRGYGNKHKLLDRYAVRIAGVAATAVAIFPCEPPPWNNKFRLGRLDGRDPLFLCRCDVLRIYIYIFFSVYEIQSQER